MSAPKIIQANGCKNCGHSGVQRGQLVCQMNPPTAAPVFAIAPIEVVSESTGVGTESIMKPIGWTSSFPPVAPDLKCGQWKLRLAMASVLEKAVS